MFHCAWTCVWVRRHHPWCVSIIKKGMLLQCTNDNYSLKTTVKCEVTLESVQHVALWLLVCLYTPSHTTPTFTHSCPDQKEIRAVPLNACDHPVSPLLRSQLDSADPCVLAAGDTYIRELCDSSDQGKGAGYLPEEEPLRWNTERTFGLPGLWDRRSLTVNI